jgi:hypothetical protein
MIALVMFFNAAVALQMQAGWDELNPGAGMDPTVHSEKVHADGFFSVRCLADDMEITADKHSDNKFKYANGANVSIIRYKDTLDREKQKPMTPQVCFEFCRTVPDMKFFGLIYGRECYCEPFFVPTTGDGVCDLPCEGDAASTCGGSGMSNIYEMHLCADTAEKLDKAIADAINATGRTEEGADNTTEAGDDMEDSANTIMKAAAEGGDMATNDMGQQAKGFTSEVARAAKEADEAADKLDDARMAAEKLVGKDFTIPEYLEDAEKAMAKMKELRKVAKETRQTARELTLEATMKQISEDEATGALRLFGPVLPMVARWTGENYSLQEINATADPIGALHQKMEQKRRGKALAEASKRGDLGVQSTCEGTLAAEPLVGLTMGECAAACDNLALKSDDNYCIAFNHYNVRDEGTLCYLLMELKEVWKYNCKYGTEWGSCDFVPDNDDDLVYDEYGYVSDRYSGKHFWFDRDGENYDCAWYEAANFCQWGSYYANPMFEGRGAHQACCTCDENWDTVPLGLAKARSTHKVGHKYGFLQQQETKQKWTVQNKCMGRFSYFFSMPSKPVVNTLDRCFGMTD